MSFVFVRPSGIWAASSTLLSSEMQTLDQDHANAVDGIGGGTYANTAEIRISGSTGFYSLNLKGGNTGANAPTFSVATTVLTGHSSLVSTWNGVSNFNGITNFNADALFNNPIAVLNNSSFTGDSEFFGTVAFNNPVVINDVITLPIGTQTLIDTPGGVSATSTHFNLVGNYTVAPGDAAGLVHYIIHGTPFASGSAILPGCLETYDNTPHTVFIELLLSPNATYSSFVVYYQGANVSRAAKPSSVPTFQLVKSTGFTVTNLSPIANTMPATAALYEQPFINFVNPSVPFRPVPGERYYVKVITEGGTNAFAGALLSQIRFGAVMDQWGVDPFSPSY